MVVTKIHAAVIFCAIIAAANLPESNSSLSCDAEISRLTPCYAYINGSGSAPPAPDCCSGLKETAAKMPACLCRILSSDNNFNRTRIEALPGACNVTTPPASACDSTKISAGYSTKICNPLQISLIAASYVSLLMINCFFLRLI